MGTEPLRVDEFIGDEPLLMNSSHRPHPGPDRDSHAARERLRILLAAPVLFGTLFLALGLWSTSTGPALTPDSVQYLSAAQNISAGYGAATSMTPLEITPPRVPFASWPPLYPLLLSLGSVIRGSDGTLPVAPIGWARILNLLAAALAVFPLAVLTRWSAGSRWVPPVLAFYAVFLPAHVTASYVWSESLFNLLLLISLACLVRGLTESRRHWQQLVRSSEACGFQAGTAAWPLASPSKVRRDPAWIWFLAAGLTASLTVMTRYLGISLLMAGGVALIVRSETCSMRKILGRLSLFLLPGGIPITAWILRNRLQTGHFFGEVRPESPLGLEEVLHGTLRTLAVDWAAPPAFGSSVAAVAGVIAGLIGFTWLVGTAVRSFGPETTESHDWRLTTVTILMCFIACYLGLIVFTAVRIVYDPMNTRLLVSAYPAMMVLLAVAVRGAYVHPSTGRAMRASIWAAALILFSLNLAATVRYAAGPRESREMSWPYWRSVVWGNPAWAGEAGIRALRRLPEDTVVLSNVWEVVTLHTGLPSKPLPPVWDTGFPGNILLYQGGYILIDLRERHDVVGAGEIESIGTIPPGVVLAGDWGGMRLYRIRHELDR